MAIQITEAVLGLIAGIGVLLIAMNMLSENIETLAGSKIKTMFNKIGKSKLAGVGIGTVTTAIIQSSGAVTVMVIGFINAGLMTLTQATTIIFGANIGTTVTAQIVALGVLGAGTISMDVIFGTFAGIGAFIMLFSKKTTTKKIGGLITGFGLLFVGLSLMTTSMNVFTKMPQITNFIASIQHPILLVLVGVLLTAILQSSSAMTGIIISMIAIGLLSLEQGIYLTFGSNIGSCVVALLACIGSTTNAKRTAYIHLAFNTAGVVVFMLIGWFMKLGGTSYAILLEAMFPGVPSTQLAMMHTLFNVISVFCMLPFTKLFVKSAEFIIRDRKTKKEVKTANPIHLQCFEENFLVTPAIAVEQLKNEVLNMADNSMLNFNRAISAISKLDFTEKDKFSQTEDLINFQNKELVKYMVKISKLNISSHDSSFIGSVYHVVSDIERIGDYSENIYEYAEKLFAEQQYFSEDALSEILSLAEQINHLYDISLQMFVEEDISKIANVNELEECIDEFTNAMSEKHIERLANGTCTPETGALYLSLSSNSERIADHIVNIAESVEHFQKKHHPQQKPVLQKQN